MIGFRRFSISVVIWLENPRDQHILIVALVPASPATFLFQCPDENQRLATVRFLRGRLECLQNPRDCFDPPLFRGEMVYDCNRDGEIKS